MTFLSRIFIFTLCFLPTTVFGGIQINEIMYDLEGVDAGREWVELYNNGSESVDITDWKFNDGSNHVLNDPPKNGGRGSLIISSGEYIILSGDAVTFVSENTSYSGTVIDTVMSLGNVEETLSLIDSNGLEIDTVSYNSEMGANGDGNSLQLILNSWTSSLPTLGKLNSESDIVLPEDSETVIGQDETISPTNSGLSFPVKQQIFAEFSDGITAIVGADTVFTGEAYGLKGEALKNVRYVWNFGDGSTKEGKSVFHTYYYPNNYIVTLSISSGEYTAVKRNNVMVYDADVSIGVANKDFIEILNNSKHQLDLSLWKLKNGNSFFMLPKNTIILPGYKSIFPAEVTGLVVNDPYDVTLNYPNDTVAIKFGDRPVFVQSEPINNASVIPVEKIIYIQKEQVQPKQIEEVLNTETDDENKEVEIDSNLVAASILASQDPHNNNLYKWLLSLVAIIGIAVAFVLLKEKDENIAGKELEPEDFKIID